MRLLKSLARDRNGAAVIETAFALPVLVMLMIGILQFGMMLQASGAMRHSMGEGLRYAKVNAVTDPTDAAEVAALKAKVEEITKASLAGINKDNIKMLTFTSGEDSGAKYGKIEMRYEMKPFIPFVPMDAIKITKSRTVYLPS